MPYIGKEPARVPVTAADIPDNSITAAKILDGVITAADIGANAVGNSEMADDAVGVAELSATGTASNTTFLRGDNSWQTAGSTSASDLTSGTLPIARIADDAITVAKLANSINTDIATGPAALPKAGGTMTGTLTIEENMASDTQSTPETVASFGAKASSTGSDLAAGSGTRLELKIPSDNSPYTVTGTAIASIKELGNETNSSSALVFYTSGNDSTLDESLRIDSSGNVGIGQTSPSSANSLPTFLHIGNSSTTQSGIILEDDEQKWEIAHNGDIAFRHNTTAHFRVGSTLTQVVSTDLSINAGDLIFGTAGKGVVLGATTNVDANTLDDYEEGTWTPTVTSATSYVHNSGVYTKIGNMVMVRGQLDLGATSSNVAKIDGLPFASNTEFGDPAKYSPPSGLQ